MSKYESFAGIPALPVELDFDPVREPAKRVNAHGDVEVIPGLFHVINPLNDRVLASTKTKHTAVNYAVGYNSFLAGIEASGIDTSQVEAKFNVSGNGGAFTADIILKRFNFERVVGEPVYMRFRITDSHDTTFVRDMMCGLWRLWCTNGCSSVAENLRVRNKHTRFSDPEKLGAVVADYPARLEAEAELYPLMMNTNVSHDQAIDFLERNVATYRNNAGKLQLNKRALEECNRIWGLYGSMGNTGYRLYNTLTHIGTHVEGRDGTNITLKQARMEQKVQEVVNLPEFKSLVGLPLAA
jgi:hypothetical protein